MKVLDLEYDSSFVTFVAHSKGYFKLFGATAGAGHRGVHHAGRGFGYINLGGQTLAKAETAPLPAGPANRRSALSWVDLLSGLTSAQILELDFVVMSGSRASGTSRSWIGSSLVGSHLGGL